MAKVALINDTHHGARGDNQHFAEYFGRFFSEVFYPTIDYYRIKTIVHLGDILDRRKFVNYVTADRLKNDIINPALDRDIALHVIIGNHDTYYKNTNAYNNMRILFGHSHYPEWYEEAQEVIIDGTKILFVPWICSENEERSLNMIKNTDAQIVMGHLELQGFEMYRGAVSDVGMDYSIFNKFDIVMSGHYHHKSTKNNIHYLGAQYEMTWADYNDPRGFHIFDTDTRELEYIRNPLRMFHKVYYDDYNNTKEEILEADYSFVENSYVKVIVKNRDNPYLYDLFIDKVNKQSPANIQFVEDHLHLDVEDEEEIIDEAEDSLTIMQNYISQLGVDHAQSLDKLFAELYEESLEYVISE